MKYIDVSEHQGVIDFERVKGSVDGIIIRAGYGRNNIDRQFLRNISECGRLEIPCGVYWFSYAFTADMAAKEAEYCLDAIAPYRTELPVCFDFEYDSVAFAGANGVTASPALVNAAVRAFCGAVEDAGYYSMVYANPDFLRRYMTDVGGYDLWLASWSETVDVTRPPQNCGIWQWGVSTVPGISGNVDTNEAYRDYVSLIAGVGLNRPTAKHWYDDAMLWAKRNGIITEDRPTDTASRAEVVQMLLNFDRAISDNVAAESEETN